MGCLQSKRETSDLHPNVFRVVNIDENSDYLSSGQLEITENDLILYREGRDATIWPLHSLRRYGFENGIFSFESGRRCETGEGIYAFKCRRASLLFRTLQHQIQIRNASTLNSISRLTPTPQSRQTLQASVVHRSSIDNGQPINMRSVNNSNLSNITSDAVVPRNATQSLRSPSSADILEVMPLYPRPQNSTTQVTNVYQLRHIKREHNNNHSDLPVDNRHVYSNDLIRDLTILRNTLRQEAALNTMRDIEDDTRFLESRYINDNISKNQVSSNPLSPSRSTSSEHYAQLSLEQQQLELQQLEQQQLERQQQLQNLVQEQLQPIQQNQQLQQKESPLPQQEPPLQQPLPQLQKDCARLYMNIVASDTSVPEITTTDPVPTTPLAIKPIEYCNLTVANKVEVINSYANLSLGELGDSVKHAKHVLGFSSSEYKQTLSEIDTVVPISPVEEIEVNYAILDIDSNKETMKTSRDLTGSENTNTNKRGASHSRGRLVSQVSTEKPASGLTPAAAIGYTTIDFDKTVALTSVAAGEEVNVGVEGCRKTRHNSGNIICGTGSLVHNDKK